MKWQQLILAFIATICLIFAGNALAQTDIKIDNTNLVRFGGSVTAAANQTVENANAFGGNVTVLPNARVLDAAIFGINSVFGRFSSFSD
jgi:acetyltransferase-like isoleucine patch superfamily enzyme